MLGSAPDMMKYFKQVTVPVGSKKKTDHPERIERGIFIEEQRPEYSATYLEFIEKQQDNKSTVKK